MPDDDHAQQHRAASAAVAGAAGKRKVWAIRTWLVVSDAGHSSLEEVGKHAIMRRTGLPARDLRVLDPMLSYPSTIMGRGKAIVVNLEHIKAVITATEVLVPNSKDPIVAPFIHELQIRVCAGQEHGGLHADDKSTSKDAWSPPSSNIVEGNNNGILRENEQTLVSITPQSYMKTRSPFHTSNVPKDGGPKVLPFEFKVLEVCLESACKSLESETLTLEDEAYPALDELTSKISTLNLERVRQIKSRLVAISGRVQKVRDELEHLLDDDMDMAEMYLSEKLINQPTEEISTRVDLDDEMTDLREERDEDHNSDTESSQRSENSYKPNIEELEMLLEAYFVQIDGTLNKLSTLREYVDDTEDYINIMLDEKQNQLLQMGVMLSTATLVCSAGIVVVSIFGMNITIELFTTDYSNFWKTTFGTIAGCVGLYFVAIGWGKKSGLLQ